MTADSEHPAPTCRKLSRREAIGLVAGAAGLAGISAALAPLLRRGDMAAVLADTPVRNAAFRPLDGQGDRHILVCRPAGRDPVAYELNAAGFAIWSGCLAAEDYMAGRRRTVRELAALADRAVPGALAGPAACAQFVEKLSDVGAVLLGSRGQVMYFARTEPA